MANSATENYQLKWHSYTSHLHVSVANSYNTDAFTDVSLYTLDGHQILAHRFILSACSQYLHQILKNQHKITTTLPLLIVLPPEINYKTMKTLVQYMYCGEATISKEILESVLRGGDILKIKGLWRPSEEHCDKKLVTVQEKQDCNTTKSIADGKGDHSIPSNDFKIKLTNYAKDKSSENREKPHKPETVSEEKSESQSNTSENKVTKRMQDENISAESDDPLKIQKDDEENLQFLVIKEEPLEWSDINDGEMEMIESSEVFGTEISVKPEVFMTDNYEEETEEMYSPLTCELCSETFALPAEWVRHIQTHTDMLPAKRQRRGRPSTEDDSGVFPPLHCDLCQKYFASPAEWVRHIQNTHTEIELRASNKTNTGKPIRMNRNLGPTHKMCTVCNKKFPSHASMLIHKRTHTGEKPYMCEFCLKGFNVKSNLLRHLRTLHDKIINSTDVDCKELDSQ